MFRDTRRKKLRNQVILAALAVSLMTFGIWLNYKTVVDQDGSEEAARKVKVESSQAVSYTHLDVYKRQVDICYDGSSAMEHMSYESCDLILLDLNLPDIDGIDCLLYTSRIFAKDFPRSPSWGSSSRQLKRWQAAAEQEAG